MLLDPVIADLSIPRIRCTVILPGLMSAQPATAGAWAGVFYASKVEPEFSGGNRRLYGTGAARLCQSALSHSQASASSSGS
jgi:hypothetical protein